MGGWKYYYGIDTTSLWHQVGRTVAVNGISVKVLEPNKAGSHSIPMFANTSEAYARTDQSGRIVQLRLFNHNGTPSVDLDWSHKHGDCRKGVVHIQSYDQVHSRASSARYLNREEIKQYGSIIRELDPAAKLLPGRGKG